MIIIAGYVLSDASKRDASVAAFADMIERARKHDGCLDFSISADSVDSSRVNLFECWRDQKCLTVWRKVAKSLKVKRPNVKRREIHVKLYRSDKAEKPF